MKKKIFAGILAGVMFIHGFFPVNGYCAYDSFAETEFTDGCLSAQTQELPFTDGMEPAGPPAEAPVLYNETMSVEELKTLDNTTAGAALEYTGSGMTSRLLRQIDPEGSWSFDIYYVNQEDAYCVTKTDDFDLKYQYEFHTDTNLEANAVIISIPKVLLTDRYGRSVFPWEIGVPQGTPDAFTAVSNSPFNYYTTDTDLVFFNYRKILSGTNAAVQVLYKNLKVLDIFDGTSWSIHPEISVSRTDAEAPEMPKAETQETKPLTGTVDTKTELLSMVKTAMKETGLSFTPGLYSPNQAEKYIGPLPEEHVKNFAAYAHVLWKIKVTGNTTQAFEMYLKDTTKCTDGSAEHDGTIVGINVRILDSTGSLLKEQAAELITTGDYAGYYKTADYLQDFEGRKDIRLEYYLVTAYPREYVRENTTKFLNQAECLLHPADGLDEDIQKSASAEWTWIDYQWHYAGNTIGIDKKIDAYVSKDIPKSDYYGWLDTYQRAAAAGRDLGDFRCLIKGTANIYGYTHNIDGGAMGEYIPGSYCEIATADDVLYAYPLTGASAETKILLTGDDYYFSDISITQKDTGYDVFEDHVYTTESLDKTGNIDRGLFIYAMFAGSDVWTPVDRVEWDGSGTLSYIFPEEILSRQPWRVKAVHNSVDYRSECTMKLAVRIRHNSPVFTSLINQESALDKNLQLRLENLSAITGKAFNSSNTDGTYFQNQSTDNQLYREAGLTEITNNLYGTIAMRDAVLFNLYSLEKHAQAQKYAKAFNEPAHQRIHILYTVSAFEGYRIYSEEALAYLKQEGQEAPGRKQAVFYDLLPFGVQFDPSEEVTAGLLTDTSDYSVRTSSTWDKTHVSANINSDTDIIQNFRGTGRTLLKIHVTYSDTDPSRYTCGYWMNGYGITFHAYCDRKEIAAAESVPNICAYMPETGDFFPLMGTEDEVACDDGIVVPAGNSKDYQYFGTDMNDDGITDIRNILYCQASAFEDLAIASESGIEKTVRADSDRFGIYDRSAVVGTGENYTYNITVTNTSRHPLKDIVIFDRLENAANDRHAEEPSMNFASSWWHGTFINIRDEMLKEAGIKPTFYFHGSRSNAPIPSANEIPGAILTETNGWYEMSRWPGKPADVQAVAVDLALKEDGTEFILGNMESISFGISMKAPISSDDAVYAYNNPAFSSLTLGTTEEENIRYTVYGNSTKIQLNECKTLEIIKEFEGDVPEIRNDAAFLFTVTRETKDGHRIPYASKEYTLYLRNGNEWIEKSGIHATDAGGNLYLKAGEKAVFKEDAGVSMLHAAEEENPFWKQRVTETEVDNRRQITFYNEYRPVLYLRKNLSCVPENWDSSEECFPVQITCNGRPAANKEFWYTDKAASYGIIPKKLGSGITDGNGIISLHAGEVAAVFPGHIGDTYEVRELSDSYGENTDWLGLKTSFKGTLSVEGNTAEFENLYKWKELYLSKKVLNPASDSNTTEFAFKIWELPADGLKDPMKPENDGTLSAGNTWELLDSDKKPLEPPVAGVIGEDGIIKCSCADKIIRVDKLKAGKNYLVQEVNIPNNYEALNNGTAEIKMPLYARSESVEMTNRYLLKPLEVTKIVIPKIGENDSSADLEGRLFEMKLSVKEGGSFIPKANFPYQVVKDKKIIRTAITDPNGIFTISGMETAMFESLGREGMEYQILETADIDYPPVYPPAGIPLEGRLGKSGEKVTFINGDAGNLVIRKEYSAAKNDLLMEEAITDGEFFKSQLLRTQLLIETDNGSGFLPLDADVLLIDNGTGILSRAHVDAETPLILNSTQTAVIQGLPSGTPFIVTENRNYRHRIIKDTTYTNSIIAIDQSSPKEDGSVTGITGTDNSVTIVNELRSFKLGSRIYKAMTADSNPVPVGSELVMRVESFTDYGWRPASGIEYLLMNEEETDGLPKFTGSDGTIHLFQTAQGIPSIQFNRTVKINFNDGAEKGDLRIVEVPELSDEDWGYLEGYSSSSYINAPIADIPPRLDLSGDAADIFVNTNLVKPVEIEKKLQEGNSEQAFLMKLTPVINEEYTDTACSGIPYSVFDASTNQKLGSSFTDKNGEFRLKAGEYVQFYLRIGSEWIVSEKLPYPYMLASVSGNSNNIEIRADNSVRISLSSEAVLNDGILTRDMVDFGVYNVETKERINLTSGDITIPSQVLFKGNKIALKGIDSSAFKDRTDIRTVTIASPINQISSSAFEGCSSLESVFLPDSMQKLAMSAFKNCSNLKNINIPDTVTEFPSSIFYGCSSLKEIHIPSSAFNIGVSAFENCSSLENVTLPKGITSLPASVFKNCSSLKSIVLPAQAKTISNNLFEGCKSLTDIVIPDSVTSIGDFAFNGCISLTGIHIPDGVKTIGSSVFKNCSLLEDVILPKGLTAIYSSLFNGCSRLSEIVIPDSVVSIGESAFRYCYALKKINLSGKVTKISNYAFGDCTALCGIYIANIKKNVSVAYETISCPIYWQDGTSWTDSNAGQPLAEDENFYYEWVNGYEWVDGYYRLVGCKNIDITYAKIPESIYGDKIRVIGRNAFYGCSHLKEVELSNEIVTLEDNAFYNCSSLTDIEIPVSVTYIGDRVFEGCGSLTYIEIPPNITTIPSFMFNNCTNLSSIILPDTLKGIGLLAFSHCLNLTQIDIPDSVISISGSAFEYCSSLTEIDLPDNLKLLNNDLFSNCTNLTEVSIPKGITQIRSSAFRNCFKLQSIVVPEAVKTIENSAFYNCTSLLEVTIPNGVTVINAYTFYNCSGLKRIHLPESITTIKDFAFYNCSGLTEINIPNKITLISDSAFSNCSNLKNIVLPEGITMIPKSAFNNCKSLKNIVLPDGLTHIGKSAFSGCGSLTAIHIPGSVTGIENNAFEYCRGLTEIILQKTKDSIPGAPWSAPNKSLLVRWIGVTD